MFTKFVIITYYFFRFSKNEEMKKAKKEKTMFHKRATRLFLKKEAFRKENKRLKNKLDRMEKIMKEMKNIINK